MQQRIEKIFWTLLRSGLSECESNLIGYGELDDSDWQLLYALAKRQGVIGILFSAIEKMPKSQLPRKELLMKWFGMVEYIKKCNDEYRKNAHELLDIYRGKDIEPVILKGEVCARYYPNPDRRALGDLDVFLLENSETPQMGGHEWAYEEGNRLAEILGAKVDLHDYKHSHIAYKGLMVENHRLLTAARGADKKAFEAYLQRLVTENPQSANFEALFLTAHAFHHFMDGQLNVRQLCDWAMFVKARGKEVVWSLYLEWMERMGMMPFAVSIQYIKHHYMGVEEYDFWAQGEEYKDEKLVRLVIEDALYGKHEQMSSEHIVRYRIWKTKQILNSSWKYRIFRNENVLWAYIKMLWAHWFDKV